MDTGDALPSQKYYQTPGHVIAAGVVLALLNIIAVSLKFAGRISAKQPLKTDDWLLLPAVAMTTAIAICLVYGATQGAFGYRSILLADGYPSQAGREQLTTTVRLEWAISLILPFALSCTRASFVYFYKGIFAIRKHVNIFLNGLVAFLVVWALAFFFVTLFCCGLLMVTEISKPVSNMAQCLWFSQVLLAFCVTGFATDLLLIVIPIPLVWSLKLSTTNKIIACASFLLGAITAAAALARMIVSIEFYETAMDPEGDPILNITLYVYWGMVEAGVAVFAACLPTLQVFLRRSAPKWTNLSTFGSKAGTSPGTGGRSFPGSGTNTNNNNVSGVRENLGSGIRVERSIGISLEEHKRKESFESSLSWGDAYNGTQTHVGNPVPRETI